jgi:hypothetical protein
MLTLGLLLVGIEWMNVRLNTTVFSKLLKKTTTSFGPFMGGPSSG